jgi:hypothetical protein
MLFASAASVSRDAIFDGRIIRSATLMQSGKQKDAAANSDGHVQGDTAQQKNRHLLSPRFRSHAITNFSRNGPFQKEHSLGLFVLAAPHSAVRRETR